MPTHSDCTLVLLNYARPWNMEQILETNIALPWHRIVLVDHQQFGPQAHCKLRIPKDNRIRVITPPSNKMSWGRCMGAMSDDKDVVCTQDDDYLVKPLGWNSLLAAYEKDPATIASLCHQDIVEQERHKPFCNMGFGSIFNRNLLVWAWDILLTNLNGMFPLDLLERRADKAWTCLAGRKTLINCWTEAYLRLMNQDFQLSETDNNSIHLQPEHLEESTKVLSAVMALRIRLYGLQTANLDEFRIDSPH